MGGDGSRTRGPEDGADADDGNGDGGGTGGRSEGGDGNGNDGYVVAVKPSARRASRAGEWVRDHGGRRQFDSKRLARHWGRELSSARYTVWVRDADPRDASPVDGYLVARRRARHRRSDDPPGEQCRLEDAGDGAS